MQPMGYTEERISNTSWAYATADTLWDGENVFTAQELMEYQGAIAAWELEQAIARRYGDCGAPITGTVAGYETDREEERISWFLPGAWIA